MADLLVHLATVVVPAQAVRDPKVRALAYAGVCLPDVLTRSGLLLGVPRGSVFHDVIHTPAALALLSYAAALLFQASWRGRAFGALYLGGLAHLAVDAAKDHLGQGVLMWGFPWTFRRWEWGLYVPEHTVYFMAPALGLIAFFWILGQWTSRRCGGPTLGQGESSPSAGRDGTRLPSPSPKRSQGRDDAGVQGS